MAFQLDLTFCSRWLAARPGYSKIILCFLAGVAGALALPPFGLPPLFFIGFALLVEVLRQSERKRAYAGYVFFYCLGYHMLGLYWVSASLFQNIAANIWVLPFSAILLPIYLSLIAAGCALLSYPLRRYPVWHAVMLAALLTIYELIRQYCPFVGFPWNVFGSVWPADNPIAQSVSLFGIYGLTLLTLLAGGAVSLLLRSPARPQWLFAVTVWGIVGVLMAWGDLRLATTTTEYVPGAMLRLVQPGITRIMRADLAGRMQSFATSVQLATTYTDTRPAYTILPETAAPHYVNDDKGMRKWLGQAAPEGGVVMSGAPLRNKEQKRYYNGLLIVDGEGEVLGSYNKVRLVPFGEYTPLRSFIDHVPLATDVINQTDFLPGTRPATLHVPGLPPFNPLICYEVIFSGAILDRADPPQWILQITNDAWFGDSAGPYQHFAAARFRAIEEGLPLIRDANSGISASVDALGRVEKSLPLLATGILDVPLPRALPERTFFAHYGNTIPIGLILILCLAGGVTFLWRLPRI